MNRRMLLSLGLAAAAFAAVSGIGSAAALAAPEAGKPAPAFTGTDSAGRSVSLADYRGRTVVLEWTNHLCPYVAKHYSSDNMQALQKEAAREGVVWMQVISSAPGLQGHVGGKEAEALNAERGAGPTRVVLDENGRIGRLYAARHTPTMAVIDAQGTLAYYGAIDSDSDWHPDSVRGARNYVRAALADLKAGRAVAVAETRAYGCTVKYAD
jgi:peroxiredoxin